MAYPDSLKDLHGIPIAQVYVPGVGFFALAGGGQGTDNAGNPYASALEQASLIPAQTSSATLQNAANGAGVGTALTVNGEGVAVFTVSGTFVANITFQGTENGSTYFQLSELTNKQNGQQGAVVTGPGLYEVSVAGLQSVQANITSYTSGTITVTGHTIPLTATPRVINISQWNGAAPSNSNPVVVSPQIYSYIVAGAGYVASTGPVTASAAGNYPLSIFNPPNTSRFLYIFSFAGRSTTAMQLKLQLVVADPNYGVAVTPSYLLQGNGGMSASAHVTANAASVSVTGTAIDWWPVNANTPQETVIPGAVYIMPPGYGLILYQIAAGTQTWANAVGWLEL